MENKHGNERRGVKRFSIVLDIEWEGLSGRSSGTISDVSESGCFVLSGKEVSDGESVRLFIPMCDGMKAQFNGTVVNHEEEIGFAVRFDPISAAQRDILNNLRADA